MSKPKQKPGLAHRIRPYLGFALPFLVAIYPVISVFAQNQNQLAYGQMLRPFIFNVLLAVITTSVAWLLVRKVYQASLLSSAMLFVLLYFVPLRDVVVEQLKHYGIHGGQLMSLQVFALYACIGIFVTWWVLKRASNSWRKPTELLVILVLALLVGSFYTMFTFARANSHFDSLPLNSPLVTAKAKKTANKPDIYYIILDRYASQETLSSQYGFNNNDFLGFLSGKGFVLANTAHANYPFTIQSISSSLNGQFLPELSASEQNSVTSTHHLQDMIRQNGAAAFAKNQGYTYTQLGSWWDPTRNNPYADASLKSPHEIIVLNHHSNVSEYNGILLRQSILQTVMGSEYKLGNFVVLGTTTIPVDAIHAQSGLYELDQLSNMKPGDTPKLTFAHILLPHPPYVFNENGQPISTTQKHTSKQLYLDQMAYTNKRVKEVVSNLTADPAHQPVIIIQADEGPYPKRFQDHQHTFNWLKATDAEKQEKTGILSAYYLPGVDASEVYPGISPVNNFRLIFNSYFGTDMPYLEDKHYIDNEPRPYKFFDLTSQLK